MTVYFGLIDFVLHMLIFRDLKPARIWDIAADDLFNVLVRVGVLVAIRAVLLSAAATQRRVLREQTAREVAEHEESRNRNPEQSWDGLSPQAIGRRRDNAAQRNH